MTFLEQTAQDYALELHIVENAYRKFNCTWAFYNELEQLVKYYMHR